MDDGARDLAVMLTLRTPEGDLVDAGGVEADGLVVVGLDRANRESRNTYVVQACPDGTLSPVLGADAMIGVVDAMLSRLLVFHPGLLDVVAAWTRESMTMLFGSATVDTEAARRRMLAVLRGQGCPPDCRMVRLGDPVDALVEHAVSHVRRLVAARPAGES